MDAWPADGRVHFGHDGEAERPKEGVLGRFHEPEIVRVVHATMPAMSVSANSTRRTALVVAMERFLGLRLTIYERNSRDLGADVRDVLEAKCLTWNFSVTARRPLSFEWRALFGSSASDWMASANVPGWVAS